MKGMVKTIYEQHEAQIAHQWSKQYRNGHMTIVRNKQAQKIAIPEDRESELKAQLRRQAIERPILSNTNRSVSADLTITVHQFTPKRQDENSMPDSTRTQQLQWKLQDQLMRLRTELNSNAAKRKIEVVSPNDNGASPNKKQRTDTSTDTVRVTLLSSQHLMQEEAVT
jgi:hypothetical protein